MITKYEGIESETYYWWIFTRKIKLYFEKNWRERIYFYHTVKSKQPHSAAGPIVIDVITFG